MLNVQLGEFSQVEGTWITCTQIKKRNVTNTLDPALPPGVTIPTRVTPVEFELCLAGLIQCVLHSVWLISPTILSVRFISVVDVFLLEIGSQDLECLEKPFILQGYTVPWVYIGILKTCKFGKCSLWGVLTVCLALNLRRKSCLNFQSPWCEGFSVLIAKCICMFLKEWSKNLDAFRVPARDILSYRCNVLLCSSYDSVKFINEVKFGFTKM